MTLDIETAFLRATGSIHECIGGTRRHLYLDALAILDMYGSTAIHGRHVCQRQSVQFYRRLVGARHIELTVAARARKCIGDLFRQIAALGDGHMSATNSGCHMLGDITRHHHTGRCTVVIHSDGTICNLTIVHRHRVDVGKGEGLTHDRQRRTVLIGHLACL